MIVQWCFKGMSLGGDSEAKNVIDDRTGIICNWWRKVHTISPEATREKLTDDNIDMHVNHFTDPDPATGRPFNEQTPFISLTAGSIERATFAKTNFAHTARRTALWFATEFGQRETAYLFRCWVLVGPRPAVEVEGVAEEVRDLNTYRRYSAYQPEGEIVAKIIIPDNHIHSCEKWLWNRRRLTFSRAWTHSNPRFTFPDKLSNVRELI
ncbi:hypothetical protein [Streptomyces sp. JNUCC 63]